jgi:hypothetical protein
VSPFEEIDATWLLRTACRKYGLKGTVTRGGAPGWNSTTEP